MLSAGHLGDTGPPVVCYASPMTEPGQKPAPPDLPGVQDLARHAPGLRLLVLFGSRSRADAHARSDWDFAYLADPAFDPDEFRAELMIHLHADGVDLVDLARAGGQIRFRVAAEGRPLFERNADGFADFWFEAVSFWCDARPILDAGYEAVLEGLER